MAWLFFSFSACVCQLPSPLALSSCAFTAGGQLTGGPGSWRVSRHATRVFQFTIGRIKGLLQLRFEHDSSAIRARYEHDTLQHATRFLCARIRDRFEHSTRISGRRVLHVDWQLNAHNFYFFSVDVNKRKTKQFLPYHSCNKHFVYVMYTGYTDKVCVQSSYN